MLIQRRIFPFIGAVMLIILLFVVIGCEASQYSNSSPITRPSTHESVTSTSTLPELDTIPTTPHAVLTSMQVLSYVGTSEFMGGPTLSGQSPTILVCKQMTVGEAERILYNTIADDKTAPVFLVELQGPFTVPQAAPPSHRSVQSSSPVVNKVYEVFDAYTGQVLLWGIINEGPDIPHAAQTAVTHEGLVP